jgi:hypothetical protein
MMLSKLSIVELLIGKPQPGFTRQETLLCVVQVSFFIGSNVISIKLREPKRDASEPSIDFRPCQEPRGGTAPLGVIRRGGGATVQPTAAQQPHKEDVWHIRER